MKVADFVKKYNKSKNKDEYISKIITRTYMPYEEKISRASRVVKNTTSKNILNKEVYWENTPAQYMLFAGEIIDYYTDIDVDFTNWLKDFNILEEARLTDKIIAALPKEEYDKFQTVFTMTAQDYHENIRSLPSYFDTKIDAITLLFNKVEGMLKDVDIDAIKKMLG